MLLLNLKTIKKDSIYFFIIFIKIKNRNKMENLK